MSTSLIVGTGHIMRVFVRDGCFFLDEVVEQSALKLMSWGYLIKILPPDATKVAVQFV